MTPTPQQLTMARLRAGTVSERVRQGLRSWAYYRLKPYPAHLAEGSCLSRWNVVDDGPYPACMPIVRYVVDTGADFLFQEPPSLSVKGNPELSKLLSRILDDNETHARLRDEAVRASNEGGVVLKFAFTPGVRRRPVAVQWMSVSDVTFFRDPLDADVVVRVRVQFKYRDNEGVWWWYREEWTAEEFVLYRQIQAEENGDEDTIRDAQWVVQSAEPNPFGVLPFVLVPNILDAGETEGTGDCWDLWPVVDRLNLQYWLWDRSSQLDGDPVWAIINAEGDVPPPSSGSVLRLSGEGATIKAVESLGMMAPHRIELIRDLHNWIIDAASVVRLETEKLTNKGNFTRAVLEQLHAPLIRSTNRKRTHWGEALCHFCEAMLLGLSRCDAKGLPGFEALAGIDENNDETYDVAVAWPGFFALSEDERAAGLANVATAETGGYITREMAIRRALGYWDDVDENEATPEVVKAYPENPIILAAREAAASKLARKATTPGEPTAVPK